MNYIHIQLSHGAGGRQSQALIRDVFSKAFYNHYLDTINDAAVLGWNSDRLVMTTDSYVVEPLFFPGGDIGRLAICGTVNDLAVMGAKPLYISVGFIIEEGFLVSDLEKIVQSMQETSIEAGISIVTGDTKVLPRGKADGLFINTAGVGQLITDQKICVDEIQPGDAILLTSSIGNHGMAVLSARGDFGLSGDLKSDVAPLNSLIASMLESGMQIHAMRDATRGGVATVLNEMAEASGVELLIDESAIPVTEAVGSACTILGFEPLYVANEGVVVIVLPEGEAEKALSRLKNHSNGQNAVRIGKVTNNPKTRVLLKTNIGSHRILDMRSGEQLPRIC